MLELTKLADAWINNLVLELADALESTCINLNQHELSWRNNLN
jgi:hypothetical protein